MVLSHEPRVSTHAAAGGPTAVDLTGAARPADSTASAADATLPYALRLYAATMPALGILGMAAWSLAWPAAPAAPPGVDLESLALFAALIGVAVATPLQLSRGHKLAVDDGLQCAALIILGPPAALIATGVGTLGGNLALCLRRRRDGWNVLFNTGKSVVVLGLAGAAYYAVWSVVAPVGVAVASDRVEQVAAVLAAAAVLYLGNSAAVAVAVGLQSGRNPLAVWCRTRRIEAALASVALSAVGAGVAIIAPERPLAITVLMATSVGTWRLLRRTVGTLEQQLEAKAAALEESDARFRRLAEHAEDLFCRYELHPRPCFVYVSPSSDRMLGYPPDAFYAYPELAQSIVLAEDLPRLQAVFADALRLTAWRPPPVRFRHKMGHVVWVELCVVSVVDAEGRLVAIETIGRDVTERMRGEAALRESHARLESTLAELRAAQEQLVQQERLRALGEMTSGVAHDLNNALAPVVGFSELLLAHPESLVNSQQATGYLRLIHTGAQDAAKMVGRLREFYRHRGDADVFAAVDVTRLVEQTVALTQPKWKDQAQRDGRSVQLELRLGAVPPVLGREVELREALTNLIFNAVDAMPRGGTITVHSRVEGGDVLLEVADTGIGMPEDVRRRCLEPFFSTKGERGTGLGLSMVHGTVRRHQGKIEIQSAVGRGTTFILRLPAASAAQPGAAAAATPDGDQGIARPLRVLVVDDEPMVQQVTVAYVAAEGHTVETASGGLEAVEKVRSGHFDLVLTDWAMPDMAGPQVAAAIKRLAPATPVLIVTGFGNVMDRDQKAMLEGVAGVVAKPLTKATVREAIHRAIAGAYAGTGNRDSRASSMPDVPSDTSLATLVGKTEPQCS